MIFYKCQANNNDFIFIEKNLKLNFSRLAQKVCKRRSSIGSDGLVVFGKEEPFYFRFYNPNGQESAMCGNALISYPALLSHLKIPLAKKITVETRTGIRMLTLLEKTKNNITVLLNMGKPPFNPHDISTYLKKTQMNNYHLIIKDKTFICNFVSFGNPHCVIFVDTSIDVEKYGHLLENHSLFSEKINIEFLRVKSRDELVIDFWERGAGRTLSCGSGSCAAFVIAYNNNLCNASVVINKDKNQMTIISKKNHISIKSIGYFVFEGELP